MKCSNILLVSLLFLTLSFYSCRNPVASTGDPQTVPKTPVEVVNIEKGSICDTITLFGSTFYPKRNSVTAPIPAYISRVNIKLGDKVNIGDVLFVLQSKESFALGKSIAKVEGGMENIGQILVKSPVTGVVLSLDKQLPGDYVLEGTLLCTLAESSELVFLVNVPYEYIPYTKKDARCIIELPDKARYTATFRDALSTMNVSSQTQPVLAKCTENLNLPENMVVKVSIVKENKKQLQILPRACVQSDEMLREFWVMKLINDSMAIKVPVLIGNKNAKQVEIISPQFDPFDKFVGRGSYGLPDTALISVLK